MDHTISSGYPVGIPTLDEACRAGDLERAIKITEGVEHGPENLRSGLHFAVKFGYLDIARYLFDQGVIVDRLIVDGAIHSGSDLIQVFELLLEKGWDVNSSVYRGKTALW